MAESIFSKAFKVITGALKEWRPEVDAVAGSTSDAELLRDIGPVGERTDATALRTHVVDFGLVDHTGTHGPGVVQRDGRGFHRLGEVPDRHHVVVCQIFSAPGIPSPQVHMRIQNVIETSSTLITIRGSADRR